MFHLPHSKKLETLKFEVTITVKKLENLPAKYTHLRLTMTRGAKAVSTKEVFAKNQKAEPTAGDGVMKFVSTMYRMPGSGHGAVWEEKKFKLSLVRINPRALREKEKSIGHSYIDLADFANPTGVSEELKLSMPVAEAAAPTSLSVSIQMQWLKNYKGGDGDGASDISGLETNSVTSSVNNSGDEDGDGGDDDDGGGGGEASRPASTPASGRLSGMGVSGGESRLKEELARVQADLEWTAESLRETEKSLDDKETALKEALAEAKRAKEDLARERKERQDADRRADQATEDAARAKAAAAAASAASAAAGGGSKGREAAGAGAAAALQEEVDRLTSELARARKDRDEARREADSERAARVDAERDAARRVADAERSAAEARRAGGAAAAAAPSPGGSNSDLEALLEKERAKAAKYKGWLEKMTEAKGALEAELTALRAGGKPTDDGYPPPAPAPATPSPAAPAGRSPGGGGGRRRGGGADKCDAYTGVPWTRTG